MVVLAALCGLAAAFAPSSFRSQSTAGLWSDDYDLLFEPARLPLISGSRAYTALSNLVSGQEEQFGSRCDNFFLIGGSTDLLQPFYPGILLDRAQTRDPLFTGLVGRGADSLFGEGELVYEELEDRDTNGTYDYQRLEVTKAKAWDDARTMDGYAALGFKAGSLRLGAGFAHMSFEDLYTDPAFNYTYERRDSSLVSGRVTYAAWDTFTGSDKVSAAQNAIMVNGWYDLSAWRFGVLGSVTPLGTTESSDHAGRTRTDFSPANPAISDFVAGQMASTSSVEYNGSRLSVLGTAFYVPNGHVESRFYVRAYTQTQAIADDGVGLDFSRTDSTCNPGTALGVDSTSHQRKGERATQGFELRTRQLFTVHSRFRLGLGLAFGSSAWTDSLADRTSVRSYYSFDNGDSVAGREDFQSTTTFSQEWMYRTTGSSSVVSAPVGIEFKVVEPVAVRLGANPTVTWADVTSIEQLTAFSPRYTHVVYGDGTFADSLGNAQQNPGQSETQRSVDYSTQFAYGLGYSPIENLQIDLMGFARLTDLSNWRLSVTFRF
jgi:hypothetical protein